MRTRPKCGRSGFTTRSESYTNAVICIPRTTHEQKLVNEVTTRNDANMHVSLHMQRVTTERSRRGFTLIELLVVIAIIALLSSVVLVALNAARNRANDAQRISDLREMQKAVELYASSHNGQYPLSAGMPATDQFGNPTTIYQVNTECYPISMSATNVIPGIVSAGLLGKIPSDPQMKAANTSCCYGYVSDGKDYKLFTGYGCPTSGNQNSPATSPTHSLLEPWGDGGPNPLIVDGTGSPSSAWAVYTPAAAAW